MTPQGRPATRSYSIDREQPRACTGPYPESSDSTTSTQLSQEHGDTLPIMQKPWPPSEVAPSQDDDEHVMLIPTGQLQSMRKGRPPLVAVGPWEGLVAAEAYKAQGWATDFVITTPNAKWVPEIAVAHSEITTFDDGRWGRHEYSQWPQQFTRDAFHIHCIPAKPRIGGPGEVLWRTLSRLDFEPDDCGVIGVGFLNRELEKQLSDEASDTVERFLNHRLGQEDHKGWNDIGDFLVVCLRHTLDRLRCLPAVPGIIVSLAAHVQRLTLELYGLVEWLGKVFDRMLHQAGIPVWYQQAFSTHLVVHEVVLTRDIPAEFSKTPSYPRLVLAKRDLSGALNMPGEWRRAMATIVNRQLCDSRLPTLLEAEKDSTLPPAKRLREGAVFLHQDSVSVGPAVPTFVVRNGRDAKSLGHDLPVAPSTSGPDPKKPSRRTRARHAKNATLAAAGVNDPSGSMQSQSKHSLMNPFRQLYSSQNVALPPVWFSVLSKSSPLPQPRASVKYFFAPPWLLDALLDFDVNPEKTARYVHHWISIRTFCRLRLFDKTVAGRPLTVSEWRDALWGDYEINEEAESSSQLRGRWKVRREIQTNIRRLFGKGQALPSYRVESQPLYGNYVVTQAAAMSDRALQHRVVFEAHETNWRCELLALDAMMVESNEWAELPRWMRESLVSRVWGSGTSGLDVVPSLDEAEPPTFCWVAPPEEGWESSRPHLSAFVELLSRWPGCPGGVRGAHGKVLDCGADDFNGILEAAVTFYTHTFISKYDRLPVPPSSVIWIFRLYHTVFMTDRGSTANFNLRLSSLSDTEYSPQATEKSCFILVLMGRLKWRMPEWRYLEELAQSSEGRNFLARAHETEANQKCDVFGAETLEDFAARQKLQLRGELSPHPAETEQDRQQGLKAIPKVRLYLSTEPVHALILEQRIGSYIKSKSPNYKRNKSSKSRPSTALSVASPSLADLVKPDSKATAVMTNGYRLFVTSDHPLRPQTAGLHDGRGNLGAYATACSQVYKDLPDREAFEMEAERLNAAGHRSKEPDLKDRNAQLATYLPLFKKTYEAMANDVGWVGWFVVGGIDEHGKIKAIHDGTAAQEHETYEQYLAKRTGLSVDWLRVIFDDFLREMFDPPRAALGPTREIPEANQSPASDQSASSIGAPVLEHPPVATSLSSSGPTAPQAISTAAMSSSRDMPLPTTSLTVSPGARFRTVPLIPPLPEGAQPSNVTQTDDHDSPALSGPMRADFQSPTRTPSVIPVTPSKSSSVGSSIPATPSTFHPEAPSESTTQLPSVRFGSPPERVLTTPPPPRTSRRAQAEQRSRERTRALGRTRATQPTTLRFLSPRPKGVAPIKTDATSPRGKGLRRRTQTAKALYQVEMNLAKPVKPRVGASCSDNTEALDGGGEGTDRRNKRKRR
uniref:Protein SEY1 (EC) n=1 Tax=Ganoderma boninense TaxID=34458 RepID=A0A5K1K211_9APHY|nr:Protein SEY1 (EC [Ganoderma boninense]